MQRSTAQRSLTLASLLVGCASQPAPEAPALPREIPRPPPPAVGKTGVQDRTFAGSATAPSVELTLGASTSGLVPGSTLHLAALFRLPAGAHIYWRNPGESGLVTAATFEAPSDFTLGEVLYPGPERFLDESGNQSFGYSGRAALLVPLTVPKELRGEHYRFEVRASWLACNTVCVKEEGTASLEAPVLRAETAGAHTDVGRFLAQVPVPWAELPGATQQWAAAPKGAERAVTLSAPGSSLTDFFPTERTHHGSPLPRVEAAGSSLTVKFETDSGVVLDGALRGVVRTETSDGPRYYSVATQLPE